MTCRPQTAAPAACPDGLAAAFAAARTAYRDYLAGGRKYAAAIRIRAANDRIRDLLPGVRLPASIDDDRRRMLEHLEAWTASWDEAKARLSPSPDDPFIFPTTIPFPRASEMRILSCPEHSVSKPAQ